MTLERIDRTFATTFDVGDGRTIVGRIVPYDEPATVADGDGEPYVELFRRGSYRNVVKDPSRVLLTFEHFDDLGNQIAHATDLVERDDGLHGTFRALDSSFGEQGLALIRSGAVLGLSVRALIHPHGTRLRNGIMERTQVARLEHVALTRSPAYAGAGVLAVRSGSEDFTTPEIASRLALADELRAKSFR